MFCSPEDLISIPPCSPIAASRYIGRNEDIASGILRSDLTRAATIPKMKKRIIGVNKFACIISTISTDHNLLKNKFASFV